MILSNFGRFVNFSIRQHVQYAATFSEIIRLYELSSSNATVKLSVNSHENNKKYPTKMIIGTTTEACYKFTVVKTVHALLVKRFYWVAARKISS